MDNTSEKKNTKNDGAADFKPEETPKKEFKKKFDGEGDFSKYKKKKDFSRDGDKKRKFKKGGDSRSKKPNFRKQPPKKDYFTDKDKKREGWKPEPMLKTFEYAEKGVYFAQAGKGLEALARQELAELGARDCQEAHSGVYFKAPLGTVYKIIYCSRIITRVLAPLLTFPCPNDADLYRRAMTIPWDKFMTPENTFAIFSMVSDSQITHSHFAGLRLKDAVVDFFRNKYHVRPNVESKFPHVWFNLNINKDKAVISFDMSGGSLHRRGYRKETGIAPIMETLAAAIVRLTGWLDEDVPRPFLDPMCGSGTILAEAYMAYCRIPAAFKWPRFGFYMIPEFDMDTWVNVKSACDARIRECPAGMIKGSDVSLEVVEAAQTNLRELSGGYRVAVRHRDFKRIRSAENHMIVTNPPYGARMGEVEELKTMFSDLGDFLKQKCVGSTAYILAGDKELSKSLGLKISRKFPLFNGPLDIRLLKVDAYEGDGGG
ncbi:MAG: class I SAM-dependent RNA methyltransferase [bacterium]|nr:class I SAM-dependent RNA methyltransferase [bacterium]